MDDRPRHDFLRVTTPNPHVERTRRILAAHPEIRGLFGPDSRTLWPSLGLVVLQLGLAVSVRQGPWWLVPLLAYTVGAVVSHALYVIVHECSHCLIFRKPWGNRVLALVVNLPLVFPSSMQFFKYHLLHHAHQGEYDVDADLGSEEEARWAGNSTLRKLLLVVTYAYLQGAVHPARLKRVRFWDGWFVLNLVVQIPFCLMFAWLAGWPALVYLTLCTVFCVGPHPLGGRWFAEHYLVEDHQETNSYYGRLNRVSFNVGYHNEHHDFIRVPWSRLPAVKAMAPEFYEPLFSYRSWTHSLVRFLTDRRATMWDRVVRPDRRPQPRAYQTGEG